MKGKSILLCICVAFSSKKVTLHTSLLAGKGLVLVIAKTLD